MRFPIRVFGFSLVALLNGKPLPIVVWHGINSDCCSDGVARVVNALEEALPDAYVKAIRIGDSLREDFMRSFFGLIEDQVNIVCDMLKQDPLLANGFNAIGISQGGQFFRAYVEKCNDPPVHNLITLGSQHEGVRKFPGCHDNEEKQMAESSPPAMFTSNFGISCQQIESLLTQHIYRPQTQAAIVPAQYFKDPYQIDLYYKYNKFLTDINNELEPKDPRYKANMISLNKFVMYLFEKDSVVIPRESSHFGYFDGKQMLAMEDQDIYKEDWIGLKTLNESGRIVRAFIPSEHTQFPPSFIKDDLAQWLREPNPKWQQNNADRTSSPNRLAIAVMTLLVVIASC